MEWKTIKTHSGKKELFFLDDEKADAIFRPIYRVLNKA